MLYESSSTVQYVVKLLLSSRSRAPMGVWFFGFHRELLLVVRSCCVTSPILSDKRVTNKKPKGHLQIENAPASSSVAGVKEYNAEAREFCPPLFFFFVIVDEGILFTPRLEASEEDETTHKTCTFGR